MEADGRFHPVEEYAKSQLARLASANHAPRLCRGLFQPAGSELAEMYPIADLKNWFVDWQRMIPSVRLKSSIRTPAA